MFAVHIIGRKAHDVVLGVLLLTACLAMSVPAYAFECPAPEKLTRPGVLKETSTQIAELTSVLASGDARNHVPAIIIDLRKRYPGVENAEVANYLLTAYCPAMARLSGLSDTEKQTRINQFAAQIRPMIYGIVTLREDGGIRLAGAG